MKPFLQQAAEVCYKKYQNEISNITFVFQSRRAAKFFQKYLGDMSSTTLFSPKLVTIGELIRQESSLIVADKIELLIRIHKIYNAVLGTRESLDDFCYWGEMLINDFDDTDKYLVNTEQLFSNLKDLKEIESKFDFLTENQIKAIKSFWKNWNNEKEHRKNFESIWNNLFKIYTSFNEELRKESLAYEGMIYREVAEKAIKGENLFADHDRIIFVGLNALTECEYKIYRNLKKCKNDNVDFYWDYASPDTTNADNRASHFYDKNITLFQTKNPIEHQENAEPKNVHIIEMASTVGQAKEIGKILSTFNTHAISNDLSTAIVLPDEGMLLPLLYSLPKEISNVNITMGYPLGKTPLAALIDYIFLLHINKRNDIFYHRFVTPILSHQYVTELSEQSQILLHNIQKENRIYIGAFDTEDELIKKIFNDKPEQGTVGFIDYLIQILELLKPVFEEKTEAEKMRQEFVYHYLITLKRAKDLLADADIQVKTLHRFVRQFINSVSIPFEGEPLKGLQIMGVLETRNLDFDTLIIPCMNEGIFPKINAQNSYVPYNLRFGFGMPTGEHIDAVYAYHFYRLIFRAKNVYFLYNSSAEGLQTGEESRYILQMLYSKDTNLKIDKKSITYDITKSDTTEICVEKTPEIQNILQEYSNKNGKKKLSASSINTYLTCPLKFYLKDIKKLNNTDDVKENIDNANFGRIFHKTMQILYKNYEGQIVSKEYCCRLLDKENNDINNALTLAFKDEYNLNDNNFKIEGQPLLILHIIKQFVIAMLNYDSLCAPFKYIKSEMPFYDFGISLTNGNIVYFKGFIDRIDESDLFTRIIDYKTGKSKKQLECESIASLFDKTSKEQKKEIIQILLYSLFYAERNGIQPEKLTPKVIFVQDLINKKTQYTKESNISVNKETLHLTNEICDEFKSHLRECLDEIFNTEIPFTQTKNNNNCKYCDFKDICERKTTEF